MTAAEKRYPDWVQEQRTRGTTVKKKGDTYYLYKRTSRRVPFSHCAVRRAGRHSVLGAGSGSLCCWRHASTCVDVTIRIMTKVAAENTNLRQARTLPETFLRRCLSCLRQ